MNISDFFIEYYLIFDANVNIMKGSGTINTFLDSDIDVGEVTEIGFLIFNYYNLDELDGDAELLDCADSVSGDELYMISTLLETDFDSEFGGKLITLDRIMIEKEFYSEELEKRVLEDFIRYCNYMTFEFLLVIACKPKDNENRRTLQFPQFKLYRDLDFEHIGGSEPVAPVMLKRLV